VRISLFLLTVLATAMVITDACLTPAISVLSAVGGAQRESAKPHNRSVRPSVRTLIFPPYMCVCVCLYT